MYTELLLSAAADALFSAFAAVGFAILFNVPRRTLWVVALLGALGHSFRFVCMKMGMEIVPGSLLASLLVGLLGIRFAHIVHVPPVVLTVPGVISMVPGSFAYRTMMGAMQLLHGNKLAPELGQQLLVETVSNGLKMSFILFCLAVGVALPVVIFGKESIKGTRLRNLLRNNN